MVFQGVAHVAVTRPGCLRPAALLACFSKVTISPSYPPGLPRTLAPTPGVLEASPPAAGRAQTGNPSPESMLVPARGSGEGETAAAAAELSCGSEKERNKQI